VLVVVDLHRGWNPQNRLNRSGGCREEGGDFTNTKTFREALFHNPMPRLEG
jgi:hypothetical protein